MIKGIRNESDQRLKLFKEKEKGGRPCTHKKAITARGTISFCRQDEHTFHFPL